MSNRGRSESFSEPASSLGVSLNIGVPFGIPCVYIGAACCYFSTTAAMDHDTDRKVVGPKGGFMTLRRTQLVFCICLIVFTADARADCARPALARQRRDAATIQRLESAWTLAFLSADTEFERCLLTPDFTEIMSTGSINHLSEELELAERNKGKAVVIPNMPPIIVHIHGDVAVAYGISSEKMIDGKPHKSYFADYYVWKDRAWHVYFAQQTSFAV
jgi:hypothetical protein